MLSMGLFETYIYLITYNKLQESLGYDKLIGPSNKSDELTGYSNDFLRWFIKEQLSLFTNSKRVIYGWIIIYGEVFDSIIINDDIPITDISSVQQTTLFTDMEDATNKYKKDMK